MISLLKINGNKKVFGKLLINLSIQRDILSFQKEMTASVTHTNSIIGT
jgi:hypothetical protein